MQQASINKPIKTSSFTADLLGDFDSNRQSNQVNNFATFNTTKSYQNTTTAKKTGVDDLLNLDFGNAVSGNPVKKQSPNASFADFSSLSSPQTNTPVSKPVSLQDYSFPNQSDSSIQKPSKNYSFSGNNSTNQKQSFQKTTPDYSAFSVQFDESLFIPKNLDLIHKPQEKLVVPLDQIDIKPSNTNTGTPISFTSIFSAIASTVLPISRSNENIAEASKPELRISSAPKTEPIQLVLATSIFI